MSDEVAEDAGSSEEASPASTGSTTRVMTQEAPVEGKRRKKSSLTSGSNSKRTRGAKKSKTASKRRNKSAAKAKALEVLSGQTSTTPAVDEAPLPTIRRSRSATNINESVQDEQSLSSEAPVPRTRSALNINAPVEMSSQASTPVNVCTESSVAATATVTSVAASTSDSRATNDNEQQPASSVHNSTSNGNKIRFFDLTSTGVPFVISVQKDLFTPPGVANQETSETAGVSETRTRVPRFVPATETSGGNQRRFLPATAAGVPLGVSVRNAMSGGQTAPARNTRPLGEPAASSLGERMESCHPPIPAGRTGPVPPRPALSARILQGQNDEFDYTEVAIGPEWGSTQFHDDVTGLQSIMHICPLCVTVRRSGCFDNIHVRSLQMGESRKHYKWRMMMLAGRSPPRWLQDRPGPVLGGDTREDCRILCWLIYDDAAKDKVTTVTVWKQLAANWPALVGTDARVLPRVPRRPTPGEQQEPVIIELPEPTDLDAAYARIMTAVSHQLRSVF